MELELVVCSSSGKPIFHYSPPLSTPGTSSSSSSSSSDAAAFVSSLQGLVAFVAHTRGQALQELEAAHCRCVFQSADNLTLAAIERLPTYINDNNGEEQRQAEPAVATACLARLLRLLRAQILLVLSDRGLDVLRKQPGYDLRELLGGTNSVMRALADRWRTDAALRLAHFGAPFVRLPPALRKEIARALAFEPERSTSGDAGGQGEDAAAMICGVLLARAQVVAIAQPNRKQFAVRVDDLLLLANFVFHSPSLSSAETWTPVCLPHFNPRGFLHAYVVFLSRELCLVLLSSQQSPEQFPRFQAKRAFVSRRLFELGALDAIDKALARFAQWQPHEDLPLLRHFVAKNELTGACASPALAFPLDEEDQETKERLLSQYARLHHLMFAADADDGESQELGARLPKLKELTTSRLVFERREDGLFMGVASDEHRLLACFDALATVADARDQMHVLLERLKRDEQLVSPSAFSLGGSWP